MQKMERASGKYRRSGISGKVLHTYRNKESHMLSQLTLCMVLLLMVFIGKCIFPGKMAQIRTGILDVMVSDTDFRGALTELGTSISEETVGLEHLSGFCTEVFGSVQTEEKEVVHATENSPAGFPDGPSEPLPNLPSTPAPPVSAAVQAPPAPVKAQSPQPVLLAEEKSSVPAVGTVLLKADYHGPALSDRDTMDQLSLGALETMTPVLGRQTSKYGWRTHPISGKQHFHGGSDISGRMGAPISAFADGIVEYIGRDQSYGLYLQLDHGNGIKSFYAHCSKLCVQKGSTVKMGDKIAEIGSTGCSTGPHLHLELKCGTKRLNPAYYIEFVKS